MAQPSPHPPGYRPSPNPLRRLWGAASFALILFVSPTLSQADSILFLQVAPGPQGFEIREQILRPGTLKNPQPDPLPRHLHRFRLLNEKGESISQASLPPTGMRTYEYPASADPSDSTWAQRFVPESASGQWIRLQVPEGNRSGQLIIENAAPNSTARLAPASTLPPQVIPLHWNTTLQPAEIRPASDGSLIPLLETGPRSQRINIVVTAEGYRAEEQQKFIDDAQKFADGLFEVEPLRNYQGRFNVYGVFVASAESGSDIPSQGIKRNTYFNSSFESYGIPQLLTIPPNDRIFDPGQGTGKLSLLLRDLIPDYDLAALLVNNDKYGGSGGNVLILSTHPSAVEIARHEFGHSFAGLGDEYSDPYPGYPDIEEPNTTRETNREKIKWRDWIKASTPIPTPLGAGFEREVGLFEGAHYHSTGWYRPKSTCKMKVLGEPYCEVCRERLVLKTYELASSVTSWSPTNNVPITISSRTQFQLQLNRPDPDTLEVVWRWNGTVLPQSSDSIFIPASQDVAGTTHTLSAEVVDQTPFIRTDPAGRRTTKISWPVILQPLPAPILEVRMENNTLLLEWPASAEGFILESASRLSPEASEFTPVGIPPVQANQLLQVRVPWDTGARFFRLSQP